MNQSQRLAPVWAEVNCHSCGLAGRICITGYIEYHPSSVERDFESEEGEECVCGVVPEAPTDQKELATLYDHASGVPVEECGWLRSTKKRRLP